MMDDYVFGVDSNGNVYAGDEKSGGSFGTSEVLDDAGSVPNR
jgi:hypothetical protein